LVINVNIIKIIHCFININCKIEIEKLLNEEEFK